MSEPKRVAFRKIDVTRALLAVKAGGVAVDRVEIEPTGRIVIVAGSAAAQATGNDLDKWMKSRAN